MDVNYTKLINAIQNKQRKFHKEGVFKKLDSLNQIRRVVSTTYRAMNYYLYREKNKQIAITLSYLVLVNYLFRTFNKTLNRYNVSAETPEFRLILPIKAEIETYSLIVDTMLMYSISNILYNNVSRTDKTGLQSCYTLPYSILSNHAELSRTWSEIVKKVLNRDLFNKVSDLLVNYKTIVYYMPPAKGRVPNYAHSFYSNAENRYGTNYGPSSIDFAREGLVKTITHLIVPSELVRTDVNQSSASETSLDVLLSKYEGCYNTLEKNLKTAITELNLSLDDTAIKNLSELLYITLINGLHHVIDKHIAQFESENANLASYTNPVSFDFKNKFVSISFDHMELTGRLYTIMGFVLESCTKLEDTTNLNYLGEIVRQKLNGVKFKTASTQSRAASRQNILSTVLSNIIKYSADPGHEAVKYSSPRYSRQILSEFESYDYVIAEYKNTISWHYYLFCGLMYLTSSNLLVLFAYANLIRDDFGKYLFLYTTHEAWIGLCMILFAIISGIINSFILGVVYLTYMPSLELLGYVSSYKDLAKLIGPIMYTVARKAVINNFRIYLIHTVTSLTALFCLGVTEFWHASFYIQNTYQLMPVVDFMMEKMGVYTLLISNVKFSYKLAPIVRYAATRYIREIYKQFTVSSFSHINFSTVLVQNDTVLATSDMFILKLLTLAPCIYLLCIVLVYLKIKLWNLPYTPEEYISR